MDLPDSGIKLGSPALQVDSLPTELPGKPLFDTAAAAKSLQSCLTLCDPIDGSPPASAVPGILQARTLEWVAISFSNIFDTSLYQRTFPEGALEIFLIFYIKIF